MPKVLEPATIFKKEKIGGYTETINMINQSLSVNPISGKIINIEAIPIKRKHGTDDCEQ